ncbi:MAG: ATP-dependent DNA ligase [Candidatus Bathyarchaeota archaeon]|nr:ATP-dependent DNA ligase [Candidatus Bathyarchaeota archaeon]MDH5712315.1 ATP-dependent DNA ligase [Candidatus Bathyarchaeota archaeon]
MTIVKPPTFEELVQKYGSVKAAVQYLLESGFTPEQIEWKMGIPYYLTRLFMAGKQPTNPALFSSVVNVYERLAVLRSKKGKETELVNFFRRQDLSLEVKTRLALGSLTEESLKVGAGTVEKALCLAIGAAVREVRKLLLDYGEHGEVAFLLKGPREAQLTVEEVYETMRLLPKIAKITERNLLISSLLRVSTPEEAKYIVRLMLGDLKLGYHQRTVIRAVAKAYKVSPELVQSACAILGLTEGILLAPAGELKLSTIKLRPGQFLKPQLAHLYEPDKVEYPVRAEFKLDGSRLQVHKWGTQTWLFSRRAIEKSKTLPEVVEIAGRFSAHSCIVDSEVIAIDENGRFLPFQFLLERTGPRVLTEEELDRRKEKIGLTIRAFDILYLNGRKLTNLPLSERRKYLLEVVPPKYLVEGRDCENEVTLMKFYEESLAQGLEGIVVKNLNSPYEAGQRTLTWLKLKPERDTIDCTIVKALYGMGKRAGFYSSFLLAVQDPAEKKLYTIGRVSNLPEDTMDALRNIVEQTRVNMDDEGVFVKPSVVVEATYQEIQETDNYTSGYALRVPKIVRFRPDKKIEEIDSVEKLHKLYEMQYERHPFRSL